MRIQKIKENKNTILLVIIAVIIISVASLYSFFLQRKFEKYAKVTIEYNNNEISKALETNIELAINSIQLTSNMITKTMDDETLENSKQLIDSLISQTPFDFIEYIRKDGMNITEKGEEFDASDRVYYKEGIAGKTGIWINYNPKYSDEYLINVYTPLFYEDEIAGVLTGTIGSESSILKLIETDLFGEDIIGIICDENDRVITTTVDISGNIKLDDILEQLGLDSDSKESFSANFLQDNTTTFEFDGKKGKSLACAKVNKKTGWKIVQIVPMDTYNSIIRKNIIVAYVTNFAVALVLILYLIYIRTESKNKQNELIKENDRVVKNYEQIITTTASGTYKGIRRVDLETGNSDYIYFIDNQVKQEDKGHWSKWLEKQKEYLLPGEYERVREFMRLDSLKRMKEGTTYRLDYKSKIKNSDGYYNVYSTTVSIIDVEGRKTAVLTTIDNTAAVVNEIDQKKLLVSSASIYISMYVMNIKNDTLELLDSNEHIAQALGGRNTNIQNLIQEVMLKYTDEQYQDAMREFVDLSTLDERMQGVKTITMEFLGTVSGWCRVRFIVVDYDEDNRLSRVLWVIENIDKEKKKSNQLLYLSETDLMTGIRNRGSGERKIKELFSAGHQGMFCLLDVDDFKSINDSFGHSVGDKVIIEIANCLKTSFSEKDVVLRLGGDEYAVFADGITEKDSAVKIIERLFEALENINIPELGERKVYVSLGAAFKTVEDGFDFEAIYRNADSCAYISKKTVGNVYTFYEA